MGYAFIIAKHALVSSVVSNPAYANHSQLGTITNKSSFSLWMNGSVVFPWMRLWRQVITFVNVWRFRFIPQTGVVEGRYYRRTGYCNQCAQCCRDIHLVHDGQVVETHEAFEALQLAHPEYRAFYPTESTRAGLVFQCRNLKWDNTCAIYDSRPVFCRSFPNEDGLLRGGKLPADCSYRFELKQTFQQVLQEFQHQQGDDKGAVSSRQSALPAVFIQPKSILPPFLSPAPPSDE